MKNILFILSLISVLAACKTKIITATEATQQEENTPTEVQWLTSLTEAKAQSITMGKPLFVDVSAEWCGYCKKMKKKVYTDEQVAVILNKGYIPVALDGEKGDGTTLMGKYSITGFPTQLILGTDGSLLKKNAGYLEVNQLITFLK